MVPMDSPLRETRRCGRVITITISSVGNCYENSVGSVLCLAGALCFAQQNSPHRHEGHEHARPRHVTNVSAKIPRKTPTPACPRHAFHGRPSHGHGPAHEDDRAPHSATGRCRKGPEGRRSGPRRDGEIQGLPRRARRAASRFSIPKCRRRVSLHQLPLWIRGRSSSTPSIRLRCSTKKTATATSSWA